MVPVPGSLGPKNRTPDPYHPPSRMRGLHRRVLLVGP